MLLSFIAKVNSGLGRCQNGEAETPYLQLLSFCRITSISLHPPNPGQALLERRTLVFPLILRRILARNRCKEKCTNAEP